MLVRKYANIADVSPEIKVSSNTIPRMLAVFDGRVTLPRTVTGNLDGYFILDVHGLRGEIQFYWDRV